MARFRYKMQSILDIKNKLETQAKIYFAAASEKVKEEELKLAALYDDIIMYEKKIISLNEGRLNIIELKRCINSIEIKTRVKI